jgi:hypothetical protein
MQATSTPPLSTRIDFSKFYVLDPNQKICGRVDSDLLKFKIEANSHYSEIKYLLKFKDVGCFPVGDLIALSGKAKSGKGLFTIFLLVGALRGKYGGFEAQLKNITALIIDNEQTGTSAQNNIFKVHALVGWDRAVPNARLHCYSFRDADIKTRREMLEKAISAHTPNLVILDGIRDLLLDFNSIAESAEVVNYLMLLTKQYTTTIVCVLHTNKADANLRGHLGAELVNKASETYNVLKDVTLFKVTQTEARNAPIEDWAFTLDESGLPIPAELDRKISRSDVKEMLARNTIDTLFEQKDKYGYNALVTAYHEYDRRSVATARRNIDSAIVSGLLEKGTDGLYSLKK